MRNSGGASMSSWIRADDPMLNGGSMVTTILESIYARGSVTARWLETMFSPISVTPPFVEKILCHTAGSTGNAF